MANIQLNRKSIEKHFKLDEKTLQMINMYGTPASLSEEHLEVEVFPNRPDLLSLQGFVRAMKYYLGKEKGILKYPLKNSGEKLTVEKSIPAEWPYAVACIVKGLTFTDERIKEIIDIQEKLGTTFLRKRKRGGLGLYPLEKIKFPVRFTGMNPEKIKFLPYKELERIRNKVISKFYLRPSYVFRRISEISTFYDINVLFEEGSGIVINLLNQLLGYNQKQLEILNKKSYKG